MRGPQKDCIKMLKIVLDVFLLMKQGEAGSANVLRYIESSDDPAIKDNISSSVKGLASYASVSLKDQGILQNATIDKSMIDSIGYDNVLNAIIKHKTKKENDKNKRVPNAQHESDKSIEKEEESLVVNTQNILTAFTPKQQDQLAGLITSTMAAMAQSMSEIPSSAYRYDDATHARFVHGKNTYSICRSEILNKQIRLTGSPYGPGICLHITDIQK